MEIVWASPGEVQVKWPPLVVYGGYEENVLRGRVRVDFPSPRRVVKVQTFIGWDRGDIGEAHAIVSTLDGTTIYKRSEHREDGYRNYDAYNTQGSLSDAPTSGVFVESLCRCTGENANPNVFPREHPLSVYCHVEVTIFLE